MPYYISENNPDCSGWAVEKEDGEVIGCHNDKQSAIDQMVAVSIAEDMEPGGERSKRADVEDLSIGDYVRWIEGDEVLVGEIYAIRDTSLEVKLYDEEDGVWMETEVIVLVDAARVEVITDLPTYEDEPEDEEDDEDEVRQVDLTAPAYMRASARRGLQWYSEGLGGDGLVDRTIREAREMAEGRVSADKWVRIQAWIARHLVDLDSPDANPSSENFPSPGVVAMALWGGGTTRRTAQRAQAYAEGVVARLEAEEERGKMKQQTRNFEANFELRAEGDGMTFVGYAAKFNSPSEDLGGFVETIEPGAFRRSLRSRNDVKLLVNHDTGRVLASSRSGTMKLYEDETGLRVEASLPNTSDGRDMAELLKRGDLNKMSFGFAVQKDSWNNEMTERTLKSVRLFEVSIVAFPAYAATEANVRSLDKAAKRAAVDADQLADAVLKLEEGADLSDSEAELIKTVVNSLTPTQVKQETSADEVSLLDLKRKQLDLLLKKN